MSNVCFDGKLAVVTGGGSGIGESTCQLLSELGASVVVVDINKDTADRTVNSLTGDLKLHQSIRCDVSQSDEVVAVFDQISAYYGPDKPAGIILKLRRQQGPLGTLGILSCSEVDWDRTMEVNLKMTKEFISKRLEYMKKKGLKKADATIVNTSSIRGFGAFSDMPEYNAAKSVVLSLTKSIAKEWGPKGFRCNAVLPGLVATPPALKALSDEYFKEKLIVAL